jgi:hypothetical protein
LIASSHAFAAETSTVLSGSPMIAMARFDSLLASLNHQNKT